MNDNSNPFPITIMMVKKISHIFKGIFVAHFKTDGSRTVRFRVIILTCYSVDVIGENDSISSQTQECADRQTI